MSFVWGSAEKCVTLHAIRVNKKMITTSEYQQLKAFARVDGAVLGLIMSATFYMFVSSLSNPAWQLAYILGIVAAPLFVALRVRNYRDKIVQKRVSFRRAVAYSMLCFGYASLIVALVVYVYFQFFDHGMMVENMKGYFAAPEMQQAMKIYGIERSVLNEQISAMSNLRPIDAAFSMISNTLIAGMGCSLFIAVFSKRNPRVKVNG